VRGNQLRRRNGSRHREFPVNDEHALYEGWLRRKDWILFEGDDDAVHVDQHLVHLKIEHLVTSSGKQRPHL
jgi:hypothetical protein